ncbi:MAG: lactate utilization protein [Chloroflexota bacterium]
MAGKKQNPEFEKAAEAKEWYHETLAGKVIKALEKNNMNGVYVKTKAAALEKALSLIPPGSQVAHGGSLTLEEIGILDIMRKSRKFRFIDRRAPGLGIGRDNATEQLRRQSLLADVFLMSTNALTLDGKPVNIDGYGNRVAALCYGPTRVIIIAGINKIVPDQEAGIQRIKDYVAPVHAKRRGRPVPCAKAGKCVDCRSEERTCNIVTVVERQWEKDRITVVICGEELGV